MTSSFKGLFKNIVLVFLIVLIILTVVLGIMWNLMINMPGDSYRGPLPQLTESEQQVSEQLKKHVQVLAEEIGVRCINWGGGTNSKTEENFYKAAEYIHSEFEKIGYTPFRQDYQVMEKTCSNIIVEIPGNGSGNEIVVIGAHYDSVPDCPAANDNASGIAALLVLAEEFQNRSFKKTLRFVAFANEEAPFFQGRHMGSMVYAEQCKQKGENITMISMETIGYYSDEPGSQNYPFPVSYFYPDQGNFIGFVGNTKSKQLVKQCVKTFRETTKFPSEGAALPSGITGIGWSDHWSFWQMGYSALMVTDTAIFRYPHYHQSSDTPDKLKYDHMARVVKGLVPVIEKMVE